MNETSDSMDVLEALEEGTIDADEAVRRLSETAKNPDVGGRRRLWKGRWLAPFAIGLAVLAVGMGLAALKGWWWLCAGPLLALGVIVIAVALLSIGSPWVHVRVDTGQQEWPRRILIHLPVPLGLTAWLLRRFGNRIPGLSGTSIDELLVALDGSISPESPVVVQVDEGETGERVEVYLG